MPRKSFAYNLDHSVISLLPSDKAESKVLPKAMAQVSFKSVYFEWGGEQRKPYMIFDGEIEAYSVMKNSEDDFYNKVGRVIFAPDNRPQGIWRYDFNDKQIADIASEGWFTNGSETPPEFLSASFALIVDNVQVDFLNPDRKKGEAPILKVGPAENHMHIFNIDDYELSRFIVENIRQPQTEFEAVFETEHDRQNEAAQKSSKTRQENQIQSVTPLTDQQLRIRNAAMNAENYAQSIWDEIDADRKAHSSQYHKEMDEIKIREAVKKANENKNAAESVLNSEISNDKSDAAKLDEFLGQFTSPSKPEPAAATAQQISSDDSSKLDNFLGQFTSAKSNESTADSGVVIKSASGDIMKNVWANAGTDSDAIKARNDNAAAKDRADDAAQAVQSDIIEANESKTKNGDVGANTVGVEMFTAITDENMANDEFQEDVKKEQEQGIEINQDDEAWAGLNDSASIEDMEDDPDVEGDLSELSEDELRARKRRRKNKTASADAPTDAKTDSTPGNRYADAEKSLQSVSEPQPKTSDSQMSM